ncbi:Rad2 nuclease [Binucleata daphniae]
MGITGLLPIFNKKLYKKQLFDYKNTTFGIDGHIWLYQILRYIAEEVFYNIPTKKHVELFKKKIQALKDNKIKPVFVFDGDSLPAKEHTNKERKERKEKCVKKVLELLKRNKVQEAKKLMRQCISVKNEYLYDILQMLKAENIEYIISPYESDAQLCYLQKINYVDYLLTQDSDLIVYGCDKILYNLKEFTLMEYNKRMLQEVINENFCKNIIPICILSGCDYLPSIKGVGLKTAIKLMEENDCYEKVIDLLNIKKNVSKNYKEDFAKAYITFKEQVVYDPVTKKRVYLSGKTEIHGYDDYSFLGSISHENAISFSSGDHLRSFTGPVETYVTKKAKVDSKKIVKQKIEMSPINVVKSKKNVIVDDAIKSPFIGK